LPLNLALVQDEDPAARAGKERAGRHPDRGNEKTVASANVMTLTVLWTTKCRIAGAQIVPPPRLSERSAVPQASEQVAAKQGHLGDSRLREEARE